MSSSSPRQRSYSDVDTSAIDAPVEIGEISDAAPKNPASSSGRLEFPDYGKISDSWAQTAKLAGRINAASVSQQEHEALLRERQLLLDKKLAGDISRKESNRLEYVRWSLDRIEDAKHGGIMDYLEGHVVKYEEVLQSLQALHADLERYSRRR